MCGMRRAPWALFLCTAFARWALVRPAGHPTPQAGEGWDGGTLCGARDACISNRLAVRWCAHTGLHQGQGFRFLCRSGESRDGPFESNSALVAHQWAPAKAVPRRSPLVGDRPAAPMPPSCRAPMKPQKSRCPDRSGESRDGRSMPTACRSFRSSCPRWRAFVQEPRKPRWTFHPHCPFAAFAAHAAGRAMLCILGRWPFAVLRFST